MDRPGGRGTEPDRTGPDLSRPAPDADVGEGRRTRSFGRLTPCPLAPQRRSPCTRSNQIARHGGPEVLSVREIPRPTPGVGEVLIRTVASSLNPVEWKTRAWEVGPQLPATLGWDPAGVVTASHHSRYRPGDQVIAMSAQLATSRGTWTEQVSQPARLLAAAPTTLALALALALALEGAAALPLAGITAPQALSRAAVTDGDNALITGAAGAVGGIAVQLARRTGATVDALVARLEHLDAARELGAKDVWRIRAGLPRRT
ncbi:alcohol dehydrogenase catalytic domain-containing protein [Streptomyces spororaveus]|uniref:alcohol dehydrogenase catalytic domain-containing protein n=1 Tax=Streptomyces spororaveus TaxID=284039 RepID=UPI0036859D15